MYSLLELDAYFTMAVACDTPMMTQDRESQVYTYNNPKRILAESLR
jgi:hypothetical protein